MARRVPRARRRRRLTVIVLLVLGIGIAAGLLVWRGTAPKPLPASLPTAEMVAAAPHPPLDQGADPPATEVSHDTVIEEEAPKPPALQPAAPQTALVLPPAAPGDVARIPAWRKYAVAAPPIQGRPIIAVIIDDMGVDKKHSERILHLPGPLTLSYMTYADDVVHQTGEARQRGHELMMHMPMEPLAAEVDPGPDALMNALGPDELRRRIVANFARFPSYVAVNNHMGSKFTANAPGMHILMEEVHRRGLVFIDSLTTEHSVGLDVARQAGVPALGRNVFLDNVGEVGAVEAQLAKLEELAKRKGAAIAIGHPREATLTALAAWLPTLEAKGLVLVPISAVVEAKLAPSGAASH